jgi:hypothetical protein
VTTLGGAGHDEHAELPDDTQTSAGVRAKAPRPVRLPSFIVGEPVGLGTAVKRITQAVGVSPCGGCNERASRLNRFIEFRPRG